jgi:DNA-binding winged helix-turn-helix (wHTH) protein
MPETANSLVIRFGLFQVDFRSGELKKDGRRIRLQEQPLQVLRMLLEHPNEVITREELQQKLWPADTFVDFDHGLNSAVARLREALNDSAERPRYIETAARRGYRFIGKLGDVVPPAAALQEAPASPGESSLPASKMENVDGYFRRSGSFGPRGGRLFLASST